VLPKVNARARKVLRRVDENDRAQRRIRWLAAKALVSVREMSSVAEPKLRSMSDRQRWRAEYQLVETILKRISEVGV
jgi:hypothetical protein